MTWKLCLPEKEGEKKTEEEREMLRGCIGTFAKESLKTNLAMYTLISAFRDSRFPPISMREAPFLKCTVSLLQNFESISDPLDWEVGKHGVDIKFNAGGKRRKDHVPQIGVPYSATFLPEVAKEEGWNQTQTLVELLHKAGYNGKLESVRSSIVAERYQSVLYTASFLDYIDFMTKNKKFFKLSEKKLGIDVEEEERERGEEDEKM